MFISRPDQTVPRDIGPHEIHHIWEETEETTTYRGQGPVEPRPQRRMFDRTPQGEKDFYHAMRDWAHDHNMANRRCP